MTRFFILPIAITLGITAGLIGHPALITLAQTLSDVFVRLLKMISLPIISLAVISTISNLSKGKNAFDLSKKVVVYTITTTLAAAFCSFCLYEIVNPVSSATQAFASHSGVAVPESAKVDYLGELVKVIPDNLFKPFLEGQVISVFFISLLFGVAILLLSDEYKKPLSSLFKSLFETIMLITKWIVKLMPVAVFAFITIFIDELKRGLRFRELFFYLLIVLLANLVQGIAILPSFLKSKGIAPLDAFKKMLPAISFAFFTKSSAASMPLAIQNSEDNLLVSPVVSRFTFPLCTTINMNACASFIFTTVLFVSESNGITFSLTEKIMWIVVATVAAIGNAGVPMGCFFLSSALLSSMNVPLNLMGVILPFYSLLDAFESGVNVWSDSCVTLVVDKWWKKEQEAVGN